MRSGLGEADYQLDKGGNNKRPVIRSPELIQRHASTNLPAKAAETGLPGPSLCRFRLNGY